MGESGFKKGEVKCSCGESFETYGEYLTHAFSIHGVNAEDA